MRFPLLLLALCTAAACGGFAQGPERKRPRERPQITQGGLREGELAPDFALEELDGKRTVKLSELHGKPTLLIFGSCTCPPFVSAARTMEKLHELYGERVNFRLIYIREAHPTDGWVIAGNQFEVKSPQTLEERRAIAKEFARRLNVAMPILVDSLDDRVEKAYAGWPNRAYILDRDGRIVDKGLAGPSGTAEVARRAPRILDELLAK